MIKSRKRPGFSITQEMGKRLEEVRNAPKDYVSKPSIKPSELSSPCLRKNFYTYYRVGSTFPWEFKGIAAADAGDAFHSKVREWLKTSKFLVENKDPKTGEVPISFIDGKPDPEFVLREPELWLRWVKADGIVRVDEGPMKGLWALEIKSKNEKKFRYVDGPDRDRYQGMLYAYLLDAQLQAGKLDHIEELGDYEEIRGTLYLYVNRNDASEFKEYWEEKDPDFFEEILSKIVKLQDFVLRHELPPKTQDFCKWCNYRDKCEKNWKPEKQDPDF